MDKHINQENIIESKNSILSYIELIRPSFQYLMVYKKRILFLNIAIIAVSFMYLLFFVKPDYVSTITVLPEYGSKSGLGGLANIASLAGLNVGGEYPMEIYKNIITSESVLEPVIMSKYKTVEYPDSVNLLEYFDMKATVSVTPEEQEREKFLKFYKQMLKSTLIVDIDLMSKIMTLRITMPERMLSAEVLNRIALSLDNYLRTKKKSNASESRFYIEKRINQVKDELSVYEERLKKFRENNKMILQSPSLMLVQERLIRDITISGTVFAELQKQLELVKLDEIRDLPVLNIKEFAKDPIVKDGPNRRIRFVIILFMTNVIIVGYYLVKMNLGSIKQKILLYWKLLAE